MIWCISFHFSDDLDVFEHRRRDYVIKPDIFLKNGHAIIEIPTFNDFLVQTVEKYLFVSP